MELYGSLHNISGSVTASAFSGSFIGDGSGLVGIQASGVTGLNLSQIANADATASISSSGFTVNKNTQIQGNLAVTGSIIANEYIVSSSVVYMTTSYASGSSAFGNDNNDVHQFTGSVQITGSISLNGQAIGTGKLDETTFQSYTSSNNNRVSALETSSGSLNSFTSSINTTIKSKLNSENVISGSVQVNITGTTGYSTFSSSVSTSIGDLSSSVATTTSGLTSNITSLSSSVATTTSNLSTAITNLSSSVAITDLAQTNRLNSIEGVSGSYATTGSNTFKGTQNISGSIIPTIDNAFDLGSPTSQWRDVYISSGSLYIDNTKVLSSTAQELTITTDAGQSIKILEGTTDSIILQTADGDIELKSSGDGDILLDPTNGKIMLKGPVEILNGQKIQSSVGGTPVVFANDIVVSGSIDITGTIEGINLTDFSSSVNTRVGNLESSVGNLNSYTSSNTSNVNAIHTATSSLNSFTSSINTTIKSKLNTDGVISGSVQVNITGTTGYSAFSSSVSASVGDLSGSVATTTSNLNSSISSLSSSVATTTNNLSSSVATLNLDQNNRLNSIEGKTGSYATTGSNIFQGSQTITGSLYVSQNLVVQGSSSIQYVTSSQLRIEDNIITVNTSNPGARFGGLEVYDSGSVTQATGSILWDSVNNRWIYQQSSEATYGGGVLLSGPRSSGSLGSELTLTSGRVAKSAGGDHLNDSNITDNGTIVSINSNTEVTGSVVITGTVSSTNITSIETATSSLNSFTSSINTTIKNKMNTDGVISGSAQVIAALPTGTVSGSSQVLSGTGIWSGSAQLPSGVVSGSSQVLAGTTIHSGAFFNGISVVSGSAQISFGGITGVPSGLVSGSSQVSYTGLTSVPSGLVSGSVQVDLTATTNYSSGIKTRLNAEGVISGSAQVAYGSITGVPSGLVSGSAQITLSSTSGFGSYLNQAVLTTSAPTFAGITSSGPVTVTGNGSYLGDWGYGTLTLNDTGGYPGIFFRNSGNVWMLRRNGADNGFDFAYSTNATAQGTGTFTQQGKWVAGGDLYVRGQIYVGGNGSSTGTQLVYNSGTWSISINGNAATATSATSATTAGALTSMNISQFTNNSGYIKINDQTYFGINNTSSSSGNGISLYGSYSGGEMNYGLMFAGTPTFGTHGSVTGDWATYFTMNNDNSRGWIFRKNGTANVASISGGGNANFTGTITASNFSGSHSGTSSGTNTGDQTNISGNAATVSNLTAIQFFNNMGGNHSTRTSFDASSPSYDFGFRYVQGSTNGPGTSGSQFYSWYIGLGNDYPATGTGSYGAMFAVDRNVTNPYLSVRYNEANSFSSWRKIYAGYADSAGSVSGANVSGNISGNASNITSYTINQSVGTSNSPTFANTYVSGAYLRNAAGAGWLSGVYGTYETSYTTGAIYSIGGSYYPTSTSFNNMHGVGYTHTNSSLLPTGPGTTGWGFYVLTNGTPNVWLGAEGPSWFAYNINPKTNGGASLGNSSYRWANIYTQDLHLSNDGKEGGNEIDGTTGDWTIQEGEENLYIINHKNGKKFKINLTEIL